MSHTMVIRQKPNVQSTDELWLQQINYLEGLNVQTVYHAVYQESAVGS